MAIIATLKTGSVKRRQQNTHEFKGSQVFRCTLEAYRGNGDKELLIRPTEKGQKQAVQSTLNRVGFPIQEFLWKG